MKGYIRRCLVMVLGILIMGLGVALFRLSLMGNDPSSAFVMALGSKLRLEFGVMLILANAVFFIASLVFNPRLIGIGTFVNWFCVGVLCDVYCSLLTRCITFPTAFAGRLGVMAVGILVLSFSCALYQTADVGIAPYDALSIIMDQRLPIPYFWCRMITDCICAAAAYLLGGIVGLGTLVCALGLGPFIAFFTKYAAKKLCGVA